MVCACNYSPHATGATYTGLIASDFTDAWTSRTRGLTCCQAADLLNPSSLLSARIDLILFRNGFEVEEVKIVGEKPSDRTRSISRRENDVVQRAGSGERNDDRDGCHDRGGKEFMSGIPG